MGNRLPKTGGLKTVVIGVAISILISIGIIGLFIVFDLHFHRKFDERGGFNYRGYRGSVVGAKSSDEIRVGLFGGSVAMGYGMHNSESIAGFIQTLLDENRNKKTYTVLNLAMNGEASLVNFKSNYSLFSYLDLDILLFYVCDESFSTRDIEKEDELAQSSHSIRKDNWVFRNFNYYFIFPLALREKYYLLRYGNISKGYMEDKLFDRFNNIIAGRKDEPAEKESLKAFVKKVTSFGKLVVFAIAPPATFPGPESRSSLVSHLNMTFRDNPDVVIIDLEGAFPAGDISSYCVDGAHYSAKGNSTVAGSILKYIPYKRYEDAE